LFCYCGKFDDRTAEMFMGKMWLIGDNAATVPRHGVDIYIYI
jgi:hypothetical protein